MAMRMDPPDPPPTASSGVALWRRPSGDDPRRLLNAKVLPLPNGRTIVQFYGDDMSKAPGLVQQYRSRAIAERVLVRGNWTEIAEDTP